MRSEYLKSLKYLDYPNTLAFGIGNPMEWHGPALMLETDSIVATKAAVEASLSLRANYAGYIPFTTDGGEEARYWCPAYMPNDKFYEASIGFIKPIARYHERVCGKRPEIVIAVGHGGIPVEFGQKIEAALGVKATCIFPGKEFGMHASHEEHSLNEELGILDKRGLDMIHNVARVYGPEEVLKRWPVLLGLAGFWYLEDYSKMAYGENFLKLGGGPERRAYKSGLVDEFFRTKKIRVDVEQGRALYEGFVGEVVNAIKG